MTADRFPGIRDDTPIDRAVAAATRAYRVNALGVNEYALRAAVEAAINVLARQDRAGPSAKRSPTSLAASIRNAPRSGTQRWRVLQAVRAAGPDGLTRDELVDQLGLRDSSVDPRVLELLQAGFLTRPGRTRRTRSGSDAEILIAPEHHHPAA